MEKLTEKELKEVRALVRLGDSKELAVKTVINNRRSESETAEINKFYRDAYAN